ncbi:hypothetical protein GCM10010431_83760 [Streptomyces kunmingensis]
MRGKGLDARGIGIVLAANAVLAIILLPMVPKVVKSMRDETPLVMAGVLFAVGFGANAFAGDMAGFLAAMVVWTLGEVLWAPMSMTYITQRAPRGRVSTYQGSYYFAWNAAFVIGGPVGVAVGHEAGFATLWMSVLVLGGAAALGFKVSTVGLGKSSLQVRLRIGTHL